MGFFTTEPPADVENLRATSMSVTQISIEWDQPSDNGGCAVTGYIAFLEDIEQPGFTQVYFG